MPRITVAVCTYDRYPHLERMLAALMRQTLPSDDYRVIVVDNSPDRAKAENFAARHHGLQRVLFHFEPRPGLSNARNAALALSQDPLIAFIDDDALARPDWLRNLVAAFDQIGPAALARVGRVVVGVAREPVAAEVLRVVAAVAHQGFCRRARVKGV